MCSGTWVVWSLFCVGYELETEGAWFNCRQQQESFLFSEPSWPAVKLTQLLIRQQQSGRGLKLITGRLVAKSTLNGPACLHWDSVTLRYFSLCRNASGRDRFIRNVANELPHSTMS